MRAYGVFGLLTLVVFAGCVEDATTTGDGLEPPLGDLLTPSEEPLWVNPQTAPHPAFNYPTLTHYAVGSNVSQWLRPIAAGVLPNPIRGIELLAADGDAANRGAGMSVIGSLAVVPGSSEGSIVFDVSDPTQPKPLSTISGNHRNVDFVLYPTGRLVAVFSTGGGTLPLWDITDPTAPVALGELKPTVGTHKVHIVPGTPIVYNANSNGGASNGIGPDGHVASLASGITEIFDLTDPEKPVHVQDWKNGYGCHHIYFWIHAEQEKYRALCAGIEATQIWDIQDPRKPEVVVTVPVHHGVAGTPSASIFLLAFSHFSILNYEGDILIVGDEMGGGAAPPGCVGYASTPAGEASTPLGALWFYDVSDEKNPKLQGWFSPGYPANNLPAPGAGLAFGNSCTAHHGRLVPDPAGGDLLAMAFYRAGVVLIDFTDPASPELVGQYDAGAHVWEVQYYNGYLFTGDLARGMDILKFV